MRIKEIRFDNYRILNEAKFNFANTNGKVLDVVVLAGVNGCGKTTVLEGIKELLIGGNYNQKELISVEFCDITELQEFPHIAKFSQKAMLSSAIDVHEESKNILQAFARIPDLKVVYFPVKQIVKSKLPKEPFFQVLSMESSKRDMEKAALKAIRDEIFVHRSEAPQATIEKHIHRITKALSGLQLQTRLVDIGSEDLIFESANGKRIRFENLSNGEQQLYFRAIYLSLLNINNGVILIDEPEAALHPAWQQKLVHLYQNVGEGNQVIMATHSPHIMASVPAESLFLLHPNEESKKIEIINAAQAHRHAKGLEPNRILKEVMGIEVLRDWETQADIERLGGLLTLTNFESEEAEHLTEKLKAQLGQQDPFIMRLEHQTMMLRRKKAAQTADQI